MKAFLMHADRDEDFERELPRNAEALTQDLALDTLFAAMSRGDAFVSDIARRSVLSSLSDPEAIAYRQHVLADCLAQPRVVRELYELAVEALETEKKVHFGWRRDSPDAILTRAVHVLELLVVILKRVREIAGEHGAEFGSEGFARVFAMLASELDDAYFQAVEGHLSELKFRRGVLISARLGRGNRGTLHVLRRPRQLNWKERLLPAKGSSYSFQIADRDENGYRALGELRGKGINLVANALAQSTDHILSFFGVLRAELAFYTGCLNLHERLAERGEPACFPTAVVAGAPALSATGIYDVCLSLNSDAGVVGNDVRADGKSLVMITGANQGGKSTLLRSIGLGQLMMQCGMFVAAESFRADACSGLFTHSKREEDAGMEHGKFDEELERMSEIADGVRSHSLVLCNESFASTNEREGSEIARQVVRAFVAAGVKVVFVTHMFDLAHGFYDEGLATALFLRAERAAAGKRTYRLIEGEPLPTSYGVDSYRRVFGADGRVETASAPGGQRGA